MKNKIFDIKGILVVLTTWISNSLGVLYSALNFLMILMIVDYISGILAARKEALENLNNKEYGINSKKSILGIYKKIGYILTVFVAIGIDYLIKKFSKEIGISIGTNTIFGLLVTIWFILNEMLSILENVGRMGVTLPQFLADVLSEMRKEIDDKNKRE